MMTAKTHLGVIVIATETSKELGPFTCSECGREAILRRGTWKIHHFAHKARIGQPCDKESESEQHATIKLAIFEAAKAQPGVLETAMEFRIDERIADVVIIGKRRKVAVEVQLSPISADEIESRTHNHRKAGYSTLWVVRPEVDLRKVENGTQYKIRAFQRDIHDTGAGALFVHREGLVFDIVHLMGYRYETFKHFKVSHKPLHLFETVDELGRVEPPITARWWARLNDKDEPDKDEGRPGYDPDDYKRKLKNLERFEIEFLDLTGGFCKANFRVFYWQPGLLHEGFDEFDDNGGSHIMPISLYLSDSEHGLAAALAQYFDIPYWQTLSLVRAAAEKAKSRSPQDTAAERDFIERTFWDPIDAYLAECANRSPHEALS